MMKPDPSPQPVLMNTVALRAASMGLPVVAALETGVPALPAACTICAAAGTDATVLETPVRVAGGGVGLHSRIAAMTITAVMTAVNTRAPAPSPAPGSSACDFRAGMDRLGAAGACSLAKYTPHDSHLSVSACRWPHFGQSITLL